MATKHAATEVESVRFVPPVPDAPQEAVVEPEPVEWVLVAWPEVLEAARRRLGTEATCPFCGRRGLIGRVVSVDEWRRYIRRGLELGP